MNTLLQDLRYGLRSLRKNRSVATAILASLALGIGSTAAIFNLFDFFLLRPIQAPESERIVRISAATQADDGMLGYLISNLDFEDLRNRARSFESIATLSPDQLPRIVARPGEQGRIGLAALVNGEFFSMLRTEPLIGRGFRPEEDQAPGRDAVVVISQAMWQREYGGSRDAIGRTMRINSQDFTIIGVAPRAVESVNPNGLYEVYLPRLMEGVFGNDAVLTDRSSRRLQVFARLKPGVTIEQARDDVGRIGAQLEQEHPDTNKGQRLTVYSQLGFKMALGPDAFIFAGLFFVVSGLVLGVACVNATNLLLSTAPARTREMAVRVALGASRRQLVRQMLIESATVSCGGALAGLGVAALSARFISSIEVFTNLPLRIGLSVDHRVALFALAVGLTAGLVSGLIPALRCSRADLNSLLRSTDSSTGRLGKMRLQRVLVIAQVTVAVVVLVVSGFYIEQLRLLRDTDPGFRVNNGLRMAFSTRTAGEPSYRQYLERIRTSPGVRAAATAYPEPLGIGTEWTNLTVPGYTLPPEQSSLQITTSLVSEGYFDTLDIPILRGRAFDERDVLAPAPRAAIINEVMAQKYWPDRDPLGSTLTTVGTSLASKTAVTLEVVGIARTAKYRSMSEEPIPFLYLPMKQDWSVMAVLLVQTEGDPASLAATLRREVAAVSPNAPLYDVGTMARHVRQESVAFERLLTEVLMAVGLAGLVLSVLGLYGIVTYSVSRRTHEIGVRMAIGATRGRVLRWILGQGLKLATAGIALGVVLAIELSTLLDVFLYPTRSSSNPQPNQVLVYAGVILLSLAVTMLACYLPARRASLVDPNVALKCE